MERSGEDELRARQACGEGRRCPGWLVGEEERTGRRRVAAGRSGVWRDNTGCGAASSGDGLLWIPIQIGREEWREWVEWGVSVGRVGRRSG